MFHVCLVTVDDDNDGDVDVDTGTDEQKKNLEESDEEKWLDALEKGELDDCGELKKMKDPALLTARQVRLRPEPGPRLDYCKSQTV